MLTFLLLAQAAAYATAGSLAGYHGFAAARSSYREAGSLWGAVEDAIVEGGLAAVFGTLCWSQLAAVWYCN